MKTHLYIIQILILITFSLYADNNINNENHNNKNLAAKQLSIPFITNEGQCHEKVKFYAKTFGGTVFVTQNGEIYYSLPKIKNSKSEHDFNFRNSSKLPGGVSLKEEFIGGIINNISGNKVTNSKISYFKGQNPQSWQSNVNAYEHVSLGEVYKGINIKLKAYGNNIEKLFFVKPGYDPNIIKVKIAGAKKLNINNMGELEAETELGNVTFTKPIAYQGNKKIDVAYTVNKNEYGFKLGVYDKSKELVIDPLLASTFVGGSSADDTYEPSIATDNKGNVYLSGYTSSANCPNTTGVYDEDFNGGSTDRFVSKFNNNLSTLLASTFIGGSGNEQGMGLGLDEFGNVYIAGYTSSSNFPTTTGSYDESYNGSLDVYVAKFDSNLTSLLASTFIGGSGNEGQTWPRIDLTISSSGNILIAGLTRSSNFPITAGAYDNTFNGGSYGGDPFIVKLDQSLSNLLSSTYLGGSGDEWRVSVLTDENENIFICGETESSNYPTTSGVYDRICTEPKECEVYGW